MTTDLNHIIKQCQKQQRAAQQELYLLFVERMFNGALRYSRDKSQAEDLVHDSFIIIFKQIQNFRGDAKNVLGWMLRILINEALQKHRKENRLSFVKEMPTEDALDGQEEILSQMTIDEIWSLVEKLNEEDQLIINLSIVDQLSHKEIGALLNITPSHSRTRLTRAKKALRSILKTQFKVRI